MSARPLLLLDQLRTEIRRIEGRPVVSSRYLASGQPEIDRLLAGGGFKCGAITQLVGPAASGKTSIALSAIAQATQHGGLAAYVDGSQDLYPPAAHAKGVALEKMLIVRPPTLALGLWAVEVLVASGAFRLVVAQLPALIQVARETETAMRRIVLSAERAGGTVVWLTERPLRVPSAARLYLSRDEVGGAHVYAA